MTQSNIQNPLTRLLNSFGFNSVALWRTSLKPLSILENTEGTPLKETKSSLADMLFPPVKLPDSETDDVMEFNSSQSSQGGFKLKVDLLSKLLAKIGVDINLALSAQGATDCELVFNDTSMDSVNLDKLTICLGAATIAEPILERIENNKLKRYVIMRCLKASSITCRALNKKGARLNAKIDLGKIPVSAELKPEIGNKGEIKFSTSNAQPLIFGVDMFSLGLKGKRVVVETPALSDIELRYRIDASFGGAQSRPQMRYKTVWSPSIGKQIKSDSDFMVIRTGIVAG